LKYHQHQITDFKNILDQLKEGFFLKITQRQKSFFQSLSIHLSLLNDLSDPIPLKATLRKSLKDQNILLSINSDISIQTDYTIENEIAHLKDQNQSFLRSILN
jgi:hypothetical protein